MKSNFIYPLITLFSLTLLCLCSCNKDNHKPSFTKGKNDFTLTVDGTERKYIVHVPSVYTGNNKVPMVIVCHGTAQSGDLYYDISGWKEVADTADFITVFPSALEYCIMEDGETKTTTKWNSYPGGFTFCDGENLKDDVEFMRQMITDLEARYNIDSKRIYMVGFSNGGQFTATCAVEISNILAAAVSCGGGGSFPKDSVYVPQRLLPVMMMFGNQDLKLLKGLGLMEGDAVPMGFDSLYAAYPQLYAIQAKPYINNFKLDEMNYSVSGDTNTVVVADYIGLSGNPNNIFKMVEVKGLEHEYPNGINYPVNGAIYHWNWFRNFTLP